MSYFSQLSLIPCGAKMAVNMAIYIYKEFSVRKSATAGMKTNCLVLAFDPDCMNFDYYKKNVFTTLL